MSKINRLATIIRVFVRYRLDTFIEKGKLPRSLRLLFIVTKIFPNNNKPRGERLRLPWRA